MKKNQYLVPLLQDFQFRATNDLQAASPQLPDVPEVPGTWDPADDLL